MIPFWRRGHLPHFEGGEVPQAVTFRLADSLPETVLAARLAETAAQLASAEDRARRAQLEDWLDRGAGACWLARPEVAEVVQETLLHFHGNRYAMHAWVIMPNHVHVLMTPQGPLLSEILHSWKSYTAHRIQKMVGLRGPVWQREYFDRAIRDDRHFLHAVEYIHQNPVKAGLVAQADQWRWSSARPGEV